jgi:hypothetical protein
VVLVLGDVVLDAGGYRSHIGVEASGA